eukprot:m.177413 g.177413  ORF g.177413 m.177413 type:complete len:511 (+) comp14344_c0_seq1:206-1738(+)
MGKRGGHKHFSRLLTKAHQDNASAQSHTGPHRASTEPHLTVSELMARGRARRREAEMMQRHRAMHDTPSHHLEAGAAAAAHAPSVRGGLEWRLKELRQDFHGGHVPPSWGPGGVSLRVARRRAGMRRDPLTLQWIEAVNDNRQGGGADGNGVVVGGGGGVHRRHGQRGMALGGTYMYGGCEGGARRRTVPSLTEVAAQGVAGAARWLDAEDMHTLVRALPARTRLLVVLALVHCTPEGERVSDEAIRLLRSYRFDTLDLSFLQFSIFALLTNRGPHFPCQGHRQAKPPPSTVAKVDAIQREATKETRSSVALAHGEGADGDIACSPMLDHSDACNGPSPPCRDTSGQGIEEPVDSWEDMVSDEDVGVTTGDGREGPVGMLQCPLHTCQLDRLDTLDLSFATLDGVRGPDMVALVSQQLPRLKALFLAGCLCGTIHLPDTVAAIATLLPSLTVLDLSFNVLLAPVDLELLSLAGALPLLHTLFVHDCPLVKASVARSWRRLHKPSLLHLHV